MMAETWTSTSYRPTPTSMIFPASLLSAKGRS